MVTLNHYQSVQRSAYQWKKGYVINVSVHQVHVYPLLLFCVIACIGYLSKHDTNQAELACNALKDKGIHLHDRSAGNTMSYFMSMPYNVIWHNPPSLLLLMSLKTCGIIILVTSSGVLVGMWPCGILIMLKELFITESKAQVYAALHELLSSHLNISTSLRMCELLQKITTLQYYRVIFLLCRICML